MRAEKQLLLDEIKEKIDASTAIIVANYDRLPPNLSWGFRDRLAKSGSILEVVRKRVFLKAAENSGIKIEESLLKGHIGVVFVQNAEALQSAKVLVQFSEENQNLLTVLWGQIDGIVYSGSDVEKLSKLPSMNEMRASLLGLLVAPLSQLLSVFEAKVADSSSGAEQKNEQ